MFRSFNIVARRALATNAPKDFDMGVLSELTGLYGNYTQAVIKAAVNAKALDQVNADLKTVQELAKSSKEFRQFLDDPTVNRTAKVNGIREALQEAKLSEVTLNYMSVLAENGRISDLDRFIGTFQDTVAKARGEVTAVVTSAKELSGGQLNEVKSAVNELSGGNLKNVQLVTRVDPEIIGGVVLQVGDKFIDMSVVGMVKRMESVLKQAI